MAASSEARSAYLAGQLCRRVPRRSTGRKAPGQRLGAGRYAGQHAGRAPQPTHHPDRGVSRLPCRRHPAASGKTERRLSLPNTLVDATQITQICTPRSATSGGRYLSQAATRAVTERTRVVGNGNIGRLQVYALAAGSRMHAHACEEAMGWMGSNLVASSPGARGGCKPRAGTRCHGVAVFPARPPQSFGGFGQLGAVAVG